MDPVPAARSLHEPMPKPTVFARSYRGRDCWDRVLEYHRVAQYCAGHPDAGSSAVANAIELPRGRIRAWVDGDGAPDPVHGLRTALDREWLVDVAGSGSHSISGANLYLDLEATDALLGEIDAEV